MTPKTNIFAICSLEDKDVMLQLLQYLNPLIEDLELSIWQDDPIISGELWKPQNEEYFNNTDIFLLLVSDAFMHSEFIKQLEFKLVIDRYKEDKSEVIPIIIDNCHWDIDFKSDDYDFKLSELMVLPKEGKPINAWTSKDAAFEDIRLALKQLINPSAGQDGDKELGKDVDEPETKTKGEDQLAINFNAEAEAKRKADEQQKQLEEAEAAKRSEEEKKQKEQAEAKIKLKEKQRQEEIQAAKKAEDDRKVREEAEASIMAEAQRIKSIEEEEAKITADLQENVDVESEAKGRNNRKKIILGSLAAVLAILAIWAISVVSSDTGSSATPLPENKVNAKDAISSDQTKKDAKAQKTTLTTLAIGDSFEGGIVFSIYKAGKTGKIAHLTDAGPMTWNTAIKIHEQLGQGWRLPTFEELSSMYRTIGPGATNSGEFTNGLYWSATDFDEYQARLLRFKDGNTTYHYNKELAHRAYLVRAIKDFSR